MFLVTLAALAWTQTPSDEPDLTGRFICDIESQAILWSVHLEGAPPPQAVAINESDQQFAIEVTRSSPDTFSVVEIEVEGINLDLAEYHTDNSFLHGVFYGDGYYFREDDDAGYFALVGENRGRRQFIHSGISYPGAVDFRAAWTYGSCRRLID